MSKRVLIVEDEPNIIESLSFLLGREGLEVHAETDGAKAMARLAEIQPELVILDVMLPNRSGFDILRDIQAADSPMPKVLMLTAKGQNRDRQMAEEIGVDLFMTKPFSNAEIVANIRVLLEK
ncbi:MAG: response regulator [Rhodobacteraceae bacterium]|nr:response regulator [Paracoccaceae bacterium]